MSLLGKITKIGKAIEREASNATRVNPQEILKVVKDFDNVAKDIGTSATRIVTDTGLDIIDVGADLVGKPTNFPEDAKRRMSDVGILSASEAIEKNHYAFLKEREAEAQTKYGEIVRLDQQMRVVAEQRNAREDRYNKMLSDVDILSQMTIEARTEFADITQLPDWEKWAKILDLSLPGVQNLDKYMTQWNQVGKTLALSKSTADVSDGLTSIGAIAIAAKAAKLTKLGRVAKAAKFAKVGKLIGRASGVLTVISIGLDIGLSVAELEAKADKLRQYLAELNEGIKDIQDSISALQAETQVIDLKIEELLQSVSPKQSEATWDTWFEDKKHKLEALRSQLIDLATIRSAAIETAKKTKSLYSDEFRIGLITSLDPDITEEEAKLIIEMVDQEAN